ncbi:MAG: COG4315 family predicted lipoprotein [Ilumatobacteraceae bacterium]
MNTVRTTVRRPAIRRAGIVVTALVALAACGDDDASTTSTAAAGESATTGAATATTATATETTAASDGGLYGPEPTPAAETETTAASGGSASPAAGATVATAETDLGTILVDADGRTLYAFTPDTEGVPTCIDDCADAWPAALVEGEIEAGDLDASVFTLVENPAGGQQLKAGDWPLYRFAGDAAPGDVNGQGSGDVWFVVAPDGSLIES